MGVLSFRECTFPDSVYISSNLENNLSITLRVRFHTLSRSPPNSYGKGKIPENLDRKGEVRAVLQPHRAVRAAFL